MENSIVITCSGDMRRKSCDHVDLIPINEWISVLTKEDSREWKLQKEDLMVFYYTDQLLQHMRNAFETIRIGYMKDGILSIGQKLVRNENLYRLTIPEDGTYCLCFIASEDE